MMAWMSCPLWCFVRAAHYFAQSFRVALIILTRITVTARLPGGSAFLTESGIHWLVT